MSKFKNKVLEFDISNNRRTLVRHLLYAPFLFAYLFIFGIFTIQKFYLGFFISELLWIYIIIAFLLILHTCLPFRVRNIHCKNLHSRKVPLLLSF